VLRKCTRAEAMLYMPSMPSPRRARAQRRVAARTERNARAREAALALDAVEEQPRVIRHMSHLERLCNRGVITPVQREAGERLYLDWRIGAEGVPHLVGKYSARMDGKARGGVPRIADAVHQIDARMRFEVAIAAVDSTLARLLVHVCVCDLSPSSWKPQFPNDGAPCLRLGLDALAVHYRTTAGPALAA
jgi:hypothetical protein